MDVCGARLEEVDAAPRLSFPRRHDDRLMFPKFIAWGSGYLRFLVSNARGLDGRASILST